MVTLSRYMALHVGDTAPPGTAWAFNKDIKWVTKVIKQMKIIIKNQNIQMILYASTIFRLEEVQPESLASSCGITNKVR